MKVEKFIKKRHTGEFPSVDKRYSKESTKLGWYKTDTMYSFLGIYVIGLNIYYNDKFRTTDYMIKTKGIHSKNAYTNKYLIKNYEEYSELNELKELEGFVDNYYTIGNLIPIWPGGNSDKGTSYCFDIPEIYFDRNKAWADALLRIHPNSHLKDIIENKKQLNLQKLFTMNKTEYKDLLIDIVKTIKKRSIEINAELDNSK